MTKVNEQQIIEAVEWNTEHHTPAETQLIRDLASDLREARRLLRHIVNRLDPNGFDAVSREVSRFLAPSPEKNEETKP